jgi:hypothetical protein
MRALRWFSWRRLGAAVGVLCIASTTGVWAAGAGDNQSAPQMSDQSLMALQRANAYGASIFHVQAPGPDFVRQMRTAIPHDYAGMDQGIRQGLANIERDLPYLSGYFANKNPQQLASFVQTYRAKIVAPKDPVEQQVRLAEVMAFVALTSYRQHQGVGSAKNGLQQQQIQTLRNKQLQGAARSYSPTCFPGSRDATCHP